MTPTAIAIVPLGQRPEAGVTGAERLPGCHVPRRHPLQLPSQLLRRASQSWARRPGVWSSPGVKPIVRTPRLLHPADQFHHAGLAGHIGPHIGYGRMLP